MADESHLLPPPSAKSGDPIPINDLRHYGRQPVKLTDARVNGGFEEWGVSFSFTSGQPDRWWKFDTEAKAQASIAAITAEIGAVMGT